MAKVSAKDATVLINGSRFSTYAAVYNAETAVDPVEVTGFEDGSRNYLPGMLTGRISLDMFWDSTATTGVHAKLGSEPEGTGNVTIIPELYTLGALSISLPYLQATYGPQAAVTDVIKIGSVVFESYGDNNGVEFGNALYQGAITETTTGAGFDNGAATTEKYSAILHVWTPTLADTYEVKIQDSADGSSWADALTFMADGGSIVSERLAAAGTIRRHRRIVATRTGADEDPFGFTVVLFTA